MHRKVAPSSEGPIPLLYRPRRQRREAPSGRRRSAKDSGRRALGSVAYAEHRWGCAVPNLSDAIELGRPERFLVVVSTARADGTIQSSVVNAGVLAHPDTGEQVVGFVTYGPVKLANLRARPRLTVTFRAGPRWLAVEGGTTLIGPDDPYP